MAASPTIPAKSMVPSTSSVQSRKVQSRKSTAESTSDIYVLQYLTYQRAQLLGSEWLGDVGLSPKLSNLIDAGAGRVGRDDDHGNISQPRVGLQPPDQFVAAAFRHIDVGEDQVDGVVL